MGTNWLSSQAKIDQGHHFFVDEGWNKLRIVARGPRIQTWVNGNLVEDLVNDEVYKTHARGFIGLQIHGLSEREVNLHPEFWYHHEAATDDQVAAHPDQAAAETSVTPTRRSLSLFLLLCLWTMPALGQSSTDPADASPHQHVHPSGAEALFQPREASGTSWLPDATPMFGTKRTWSSWSVMLHGAAFPQFLYEPANPHRTGGFSTHQFFVVNWGMLQARRRAGEGRFGVRAMISLEPWTLGDCGYISYLATGEVCEGDTIHDRQHPHDLFMELAADYDRPLLGSWRWQIYGGLSGEPALGPVSFPHGFPPWLNPIAPISHHWMDATHISFGVVTAGATTSDGRSKDRFSMEESRTRIVRISTWARSTRFRDADVPAEREVRASSLRRPPCRGGIRVSAAAAQRYRQADGLADLPSPVDQNGIWASTLAYGVNAGRVIIPADEFDATTQALLFETSVDLRDTHTFFGRAEVVEKPAEDLHAHEFARSIFTLAKLQAGYVRELKPWNGLRVGFGGTASISIVPEDLASRYDGRVAPGFGVFVSLRPSHHLM